MVRNYRKDNNARKYTVVSTADSMQCLEKVKSGEMSHAEAARQTHCSRQTIYNKLCESHQKQPGHQKVFTEAEELSFSDHLSCLSEWGFPVGTDDLREIVRIYLTKQEIKVPTFVNNKPSRDRVARFLRDHQQLSKRFAQNIKLKRAAITRETIAEYMANLKESLEGVPASNIFNYDETNLSDDPGKKHAICKRGLKYFENVRNFIKSATSVMFCGSATGELLPPYVVFKAEHLWDSWTLNGPRGTRYNRSASGWFDERIFEDWFKTLFLPAIRHLNGPIALIGDNLSSHLNPTVIEICRQKYIKFICLPPNATHLTKPLDVAFFSPMKREWRKILGRWRASCEGSKSATIPKGPLGSLISELLKALAPHTRRILISGFRKCGIVPWNPHELINQLPSDSLKPELIGDSFKQFLKEHRNDVIGCPVGPQPKKKLKVSPGKSVSLDEIPKRDSKPISKTPGKRGRKPKITSL
ncbi:uncharacterized protein LOC129779755 [Toxorhynchites rutilus septentrionalis]|uniref:uncharacterized protein LOC129779755 n=1 Tax=Toxorhynchites rutilus septentrionalis TaxID=329112 RepID=UPI00247AFC9E|nr:uncharacterized protein LOC129779755 [Toxorhynchites rutilus septentrionalis]